MSLSPVETTLIHHPDPARLRATVLAWCAINTGTANLPGLAAQAAALADAFAALPGELALHDPAPVTRIAADGSAVEQPHGRHLVLRVRPQAQTRVLLTGHMDTVFPADHPFQSARWLDDATLNAPGAADMKGGLAVLLAGLAAFETTQPRLGYDVLVNADEETGSLSSAALLATLASGKAAALTYEPALPDGGMARARPGSGNFSAIVTGKAAHAGRNPHDGRNAVLAAADLALRLAALAHAGLTVNPAKIDGGGPNNVVPAHAVLRFNLRPATPADETAARVAIDRCVAAVAAAHDVAIHLHGHFNRPPKPVAPATSRLYELVRAAAADLGQPLAWADTGGVCDGNNIAALGVPVLDTMGALGGAIHSADEFLCVDSLAPRAALTALVLHRLDMGELP
ncbi:MAG: hydrolase [Sphingomonadales bacterium]|nr:hydrolase [Sphingomonadales bacterium]